MIDIFILFLYIKQEKSYFLFIILLANIIFIFILNQNNNCNDNINLSKYINYTFFTIMNKLNSNDSSFLLKENNTRIENIFILTEIMPFIKRNIIIKEKNNKEIFQLCKHIFKEKKITNILIINKNDFYYFINNFNRIIFYEWELIPKINLINKLRYLINNFYNENCLNSFDKALNFNLNKYIKKNKNTFSFHDINNLMSEYYNYLFIL